MKTQMTKEYKLIPIKGKEIETIKIDSSKASYDFVKEFYNEDIEIYESAFILMLNRANKTIGWVKISSGGIAGTVMDVKLLARYAISNLVSGVILVHNHPSGNLRPSESDLTITNKIKKALQLIDTQLMDHLIITPEGEYYSFADEGDL